MKAPKILTAIGCLGLGLSLAGVGITLALPEITSGRTSWDEAMLGLIPAVLCSCTSLLPLVGGIVWLLVARRKATPSA